MKKRIGAAVLALSLAVSMALPLSAAGVVSQEEAAQVVGALNIMVGDENGDLQLDKTVTRAEFITMAVKASTRNDQVGEASTAPYPDVPRKHWSAGYVAAGVKMGLISGYLDGTFRPNNQITLAEGATIVLKLLGYTSGDFSGAYPTAQMALYRSLGLDEGLWARENGEVLNRRDAMYLFYNLLSTKNKNGQYHLNTLGYSLNANGEVDRVALMNEVMDGPVVAEAGWQKHLPFALSQATVTRAGKPSTPAAIQDGDVVYWNKGMRRVWVYTDRITGTVQEINPSISAPTSVTVAGHTYPLEGSQAVYALSQYGGYRVGDVVTLALGRDGGAAAVLSPNAGERSKVGMVTAVQKGSYTGSNGSTYADDTVTILATDGKSYSYQYSARYLEVGAVVQVVVNDAGELTIKRLQKQEVSISGKVNAEGTAMGKYPFAADVEIMDTYEDTALKLYPSRLAGVNLTEEKVRYYTLNAQGEIQHLILDDATGDLHHYGIMTQVQDLSMGMSIQVYYYMDFAGQETVYSSTVKRYPVEKGPFMLMGNVNDPDMIRQLKKATVDRIQGRGLVCGSITYPMTDNTLVYELRDGRYYLTYLDRVDDGGHKLTAWYDQTPGNGGCVRVLIAQEK